MQRVYVQAFSASAAMRHARAASVCQRGPIRAAPCHRRPAMSAATVGRARLDRGTARRGYAARVDAPMAPTPMQQARAACVGSAVHWSMPDAYAPTDRP